MRVWYLSHSGFLLETAQSYYIFDYYRGALPQLDPGKPVAVLASHGHRDHYQPKVFDLLRQMGMRDILAVLAQDIPKKSWPEGIEVLRVDANRTYDLPHGERMETLRSTDLGVAFLLETGEGTVYHAGDLNDWYWEGDDEDEALRARYRREIDTLRGKPMALAFVPLDPRLETHYADGLLYFLSCADARRVYPMHYWKQPQVIERFLKDYPQYAATVLDTEQLAGGDLS